jgi:hypothetical protein
MSDERVIGRYCKSAESVALSALQISLRARR